LWDQIYQQPKENKKNILPNTVKEALKCSKCGSTMKVVAIITQADEVRKILMHLVKIGRPPPGFDPSSLN